jgi:hypothetical protein
MENSEIIDEMILGEYVTGDSSDEMVIRQAKVSPNKKRYFVHESTQNIENDSLLRTKIVFYDAEKNSLREDSAAGDRSISFELSDIRDSLFIITKCDRFYGKPAFFVIMNGETVEVIQEGEWQRIVSYKISPNDRYILFHTRNPYYGKPWDYIYFWDLETSRSWDYLFPTCLSCKKARIDLDVDDSGRSEVIHKKEHRIFSKEGVLVDIYLKIH